VAGVRRGEGGRVLGRELDGVVALRDHPVTPTEAKEGTTDRASATASSTTTTITVIRTHLGCMPPSCDTPPDNDERGGLAAAEATPSSGMRAGYGTAGGQV